MHGLCSWGPFFAYFFWTSKKSKSKHPTYLKDSIAFLFILLVLLLQPEGLFGKQRREKV